MTPRGYLCCGFFASLAATFDLPAAAFLAAIGIPLLIARTKNTLLFFAPGVLVESGPAADRPAPPAGAAAAGGGGPMGSGSYPEGVKVPERLVMDGYGLHPEAIGPPYTTLTARSNGRLGLATIPASSRRAFAAPAPRC